MVAISLKTALKGAKPAVKSAAGAFRPSTIKKSGLGEPIKMPLADLLEAHAKKVPAKTAVAAAKEEAAVKKPVAKEPVAKEPVAKEPVAKEPVAKEPVAKEPVAKEPVAKKTAAKKSVAKATKRPAGNPWDKVVLPHSSSGWWKVTTHSMTLNGSWNYSWKFNDVNLAKKAAFDLTAINDLQSLAAGSPAASNYLHVANLPDVVSLIGKS